MGDEASDAALLDRWVAGDAAAGERLFERHFDSICRFLRPKVSEGLEDLVQRVFLGCLEGRQRLRDHSSFRAYLFGIARRQLLLHYREKRRHANLDFGVTSLSDLGTTPSGHLARNNARQELQVALLRLPVDQQIALELTYWENLTGAEVAEALGISTEAAYTRIRRARDRLGEILREAGTDEACLPWSDRDVGRRVRARRS